MQRRLSPITLAALGALGGALVMTSLPSYAQASGQRIEVTGSRIKRVDTESSNPVTMITREEIERTGAATLNDALQRITGAGGTLDDRTTNGFAPGGGGLNLRSLGFNSTLVLINGRRMPTYPFAQQVGTAQGFQDLQNIPMDAVERIDILKDGASAIYGADAVAGVVNIILRREYQGLELGGGVGLSSRGDGQTLRGNLTAGFGNLGADRYNVLLAANVSTRDPIASRERSFAGTEDLRARGGRDRRSAYGDPGTIFDLVDADADPYYMAGCGPSTQQGGSSVGAGAICRYDRARFGALQPESNKAGLYGRVTFALSPEISTFAEVMLTQNRFKSSGWPAGTTDDVGLGSYIIPAGTPGNPFPNDAEVLYRFSDAGIRGDNGKSTTSRLLLGASGVTAGWDWEAAVNVNRIKIDNIASNNALVSRVMCLTNPQAAAAYAAGGDPLGFGTLNDIFAANPSYASYFRNELGKCGTAFAQYGYYNYANPRLNNPGVGAYIRHDAARAGRSELDGFDLRATREIGRLDGGPLGLAFGIDYRREKVSDIPDQQLQTGDTLSISAAQAFGSRKVMAAFAELAAPLSKTFEASLAVRHDRYSGNGSFSSTSPKIGVKWKVANGVLLRSTVSQAFRAPSLFETTPAQQTSFAFGIQDPRNCPDASDQTNPDCAIDVRRVQQGNPSLKPERSTARTFGAIFEPMNNVSITLDIWKIERRDEIGSFEDQLLVDLFANDPTIVVRTPQGKISQINQVPVQLNSTQTVGADLDMAFRNDLGSVGRLTSKLGVGYTKQYLFTTLDANRRPATDSLIGRYNYPRIRTNWDFALTRGAWEVSLGGYGVGGYAGLGNTQRVGAFEVWNMGVSYTGIKNLRLRAGINNLLDKAPPFNDETSGANAGYNPQFGDVVGRFFTLGASYRF